MSEQIIQLPDVLKMMETGNPFSLRVVSFDKAKGTGGDILDFPSACLFKSGTEAKKAINHIPTTTESTNGSSIPNHWSHATRNIQIVPSMHIRKIHIRLITAFNGKKVVY